MSFVGKFLVFTFLLVATLPGQAAYRVFLKLDNIEGESLDENHRKWIDVDSFSQRLSRPPGPLQPIEGTISVWKRVDKSSPALRLHCNKGTFFTSATIEFVRFTEGGFRFYQIELSRVRVRAVSESGSSGGGDVFESIDLDYERIEWTYTPQRPDGSAEPAITAFWDIPENRGGIGVPTPDNDNDGIPDSSDPDDDNDGIPDVYESANGLNPFSNDANGDLDHDGMSNYNEFIAGTSANNPNSVFRVLRTSTNLGTVQITWSSVAGKNYEVLSSSEPNGPFSISTNTASAGNGETSASIPVNESSRFFRIRVLP